MANEIKTVKVDCPEHKITNKSLVYQHAENLLVLQKKMGRKDWVISEGQNLIFKDGKIIKSGSDKK